MDTQKEYATLMEAYNAVYENQEQLDGNILEGSYEDRIAANNKKYDANRKRAAQRAQARNEARARGENVGSSRPERTTYRDSAGVERHHSGARMPKNEEVETDFFDVILEHLVAEGYADTNKAALAIMANMSEEWKQSIVEQSNTLVTPEQRRADELKYGMKRTTQVPPPKPPAVKRGPRMPL